ncbi:MAG: alpha/beta hydrolase-fold protein [Anaerolineales bacterium]
MTTVTPSLIQRAFEEGNPVIHGDRAVFLWQGETAPWLVGDFDHWGGRPRRFKRLSPRLAPGSAQSIWYAALTFPRDAYVEYAFRDPVSQENFPDPLNRKTVGNGMGGRNNYFYMPETMPSPYPLRRADVTPGAITNHRVETRWLREDYEREIYFYRPPVKQPVPLLVVYDGQDYLQRARLNVIVDNLIAEGRIQPMAMAFLPSGGRWRSVEYACSDGTLLWLDQIVLPLAREKLNLLDVKKQPGAWGVLGASLGGTMAFYTGLRMPEVFGKVISQAGAFNIENRNFVVVDLVRHGQARGLEVWMDVGRLDILLEDNRWMYALLQEKGYKATCREFTAGHNYTAWRDDVWRGLEALYPA